MKVEKLETTAYVYNVSLTETEAKVIKALVGNCKIRQNRFAEASREIFDSLVSAGVSSDDVRVTSDSNGSELEPKHGR